MRPGHNNFRFFPAFFAPRLPARGEKNRFIRELRVLNYIGALGPDKTLHSAPPLSLDNGQ